MGQRCLFYRSGARTAADLQMVHLRLTHAGSMSGAVKPANAILPPPTRVRLTGLVQASQYNGRIVKIVRTDLEAGRYEVTMFEDEDTKRVQKALRLKFENALLW